MQSYSQTPANVYRSSPSVISNDAHLHPYLSFYLPTAVDTSSALTGRLDSLGMLIYVRSSGKIYKRDTSLGTHKWSELGSGGTGADSSIFATVTRLADSSAALRGLLSSGFDSSSSQGGGFHTQPYNDARYFAPFTTTTPGIVTPAGAFNSRAFSRSDNTFQTVVIPADTTAKWIGWGYRSHDSVYLCKGNPAGTFTCAFAWKDSVGGGGGGTTDLPTAISQHTIFSDDDSVNLGAHKLKFQNGFLQADKFRFGFTDSARTKGAMYIGDSVIMSFYDPNQPGKNIFFGMGSGPTFGAITPGGDNGSLLIAIGTNSYNPCTTCHENTSVGNQNMQYCTTCLGNAMFGETAGRLITTGADNTAVGVHALNSQTTANNNTAVGKRALETTTTGNDNTGIGWQVMDKNTTGNSNTAAGHSALENNTTGADNVAVGKQALDANTTGSYNIAIGRHSMAYNTNGIENVAVGEEAGSITNAVHDNTGVYLGFQASRDASVGSGTTLNNTIAIGYNAKATCSGCAVLGGTGTDSINVAIGTKAPDASAILDLTSGNRGMFIPRMTTTKKSAISSPKKGLLVFDSTLNELDFYDGTGWTNVGLGGSGFTFGSGLTNSSGTVTNDLITGKSGGQTVVGGTASGNNLTLSSTSNATKGKIIIGTASAYDQTNDRIGIGTTSPAAALHINSASTSLAMKISDNSSFTARFSSDGSGNFRVAPGATSSFIIGGQGSDGGTFTNSALFNTNNGNTVLTSADLGSPLDWTDRSGNARGRLSITANLQAAITTASTNSLAFGWQSSVGGTFTENARFSATNGHFLLKTTTDSSSYLHIGAGDATHAPLKLTAGALLTSPKNGVIEFDGGHFYGTAGGTRYQFDQQSAGSSSPFSDASALVKNSSDATKLLKLSAASITTGTTRTWTFPDVNGTVARNDAAQTFTGVQTFSSSPIVPTPSSGTDAVNKTYADGLIPTGGLASGTYSPTISNYVNCSAVSNATFQYMKIGKQVWVLGYATVELTASSGNFSFFVSLPTVTTAAPGGGSGTQEAASGTYYPALCGGTISGGAGVEAIHCNINGTSGDNVNVSFQFMYITD